MFTKLKELFYKLIRPLFVKNIDTNEDFDCMYCGSPLLKRHLYCSDKCAKLDRQFEDDMSAEWDKTQGHAFIYGSLNKLIKKFEKPKKQENSDKKEKK